MPDLITATRAKYAIPQTSFTSDENDRITALLASVSGAVRRYCRREFDSQSFDELYPGTGTDTLVLRQSPVISIGRVACQPSAVLRVTNTSSSNQRATVSVTATGLTLVRVASGTVTTDTSVTFSGNATLSAIATAVNALGNGWSAEAIAPYTLWPSADLRRQGAYWCAAGQKADILLHVVELADYEADLNAGTLTRRAVMLWEDDDPAGWHRGAEYRVLYTAGYATVPEDVQEACAEWVAHLFARYAKHDPDYASKATSDSTDATSESWRPLADIPEPVRALLAPHRTRFI